MSKFRIPRKKKKQIPKGYYCYVPTSPWKQLKGGNYGFTIKTCVFYSNGCCNLLKCEIDDQVKECGERKY